MSAFYESVSFAGVVVKMCALNLCSFRLWLLDADWFCGYRKVMLDLFLVGQLVLKFSFG